MERLDQVDYIIAKYYVASGSFKRKFYVVLGSLFVVFAIIGIWIPGWPTVSWAVPAAFFFSISNKKLFRWSLTNRYFGNQLLTYYVTGKTLTKHVKLIVITVIFLMSLFSSYCIWHVSTRGEGGLITDSSTWSGKDASGSGAIAVLILGFLGVIYVLTMVKSRSR